MYLHSRSGARGGDEAEVRAEEEAVAREGTEGEKLGQVL